MPRGALPKQPPGAVFGDGLEIPGAHYVGPPQSNRLLGLLNRIYIISSSRHLRLYLAEGGTVDAVFLGARGPDGLYPINLLTGLCLQRRTDDIKALLRAGADVNLKSDNFSCALGTMFAINDDDEYYMPIIDLLISNGADINVGNGILTPLMYAAAKGDVTGLKYLLDKGMRT